MAQAAGNDINEIINKIQIQQVKNIFAAAQQYPPPKYAQLCDGGVYMGIMNVYFGYTHKSGLKFCGNGWINKLNANGGHVKDRGVSAEPDYCKYHTLVKGDRPTNPPKTIDVNFEFLLFKEFRIYNILTHPNAEETYAEYTSKDPKDYHVIQCQITLNRPTLVDRTDDNFHEYRISDIKFGDDLENEEDRKNIINRLAQNNKYILEFQSIPMHAKVPGLHMASTVGFPFEHLTVLLGGHGYKKKVAGESRYNCKLFAQYKFSRDQWKDKKIIYTAMKCLLTKFECMYNYLINNENTHASTELFCQVLLDYITPKYIEEVLDIITEVKDLLNSAISMTEIRQTCEYTFIKNCQSLLTHKWKYENGSFKYELKDFRSRLSLSETSNGVSDVRAIAYNVVSCTIEPMENFINTRANCTIDVDEDGLGNCLSMQPDLVEVDAGDKINVFNVHDVFRTFVSILFRGMEIPGRFRDVLNDAKQLISNMKCYKTSSNLALKFLIQSCDDVQNVCSDFADISNLMIDTSRNFITLLLKRNPSTNHSRFVAYIQRICDYLSDNNSDDVIVTGIPPTDDYVVHFQFNDTRPRYKEHITTKQFVKIVAATQLQIIASMRRIENDPSLDISGLQFKNYIQLTSDAEGGSEHDITPPTFGLICNVDNLMDILYPASIYDEMYWRTQTENTPRHDLLDTDILFYRNLKMATDTLNNRNLNHDHSEGGRKNFKNQYLNYDPPVPNRDEENPVIYVNTYIKGVSHLLLDTLNENVSRMKHEYIHRWFTKIRFALIYIQSHAKKIFHEDVNCTFKCTFPELSNSEDKRQEVLRTVHDSYTTLKRKSYTNREIESEMKDRTAESIFNKHTTDSRKMSKEQFYSAWNDIMESKLHFSKSETPENAKEDVFNRLSRPYNYLEKIDDTDNYIDMKSFKLLFLGNLKVNVYIEFVKILYFHIQIIANLLQADANLRPDTFTVKDPTDREKNQDFNETDTNIEKARFFLASKYSEWWNFGSDDKNSTRKIMEARSVICDNIYTDKSVDTKFIQSAFSYMNDIKSRSGMQDFIYEFTSDDQDKIKTVCNLNNVYKYEIDQNEKRVMIGYKLPGEGQVGLQKKWGLLPNKIPEDFKSKIIKTELQFGYITLYFTIHEREVIKIKLHDGTCIDVPLDPKLVCHSYFKIENLSKIPVPMNGGRKYIWNFDTGVWEQTREVWLTHRIVKIVEEAGDLHNALFSNDVDTAMRSLFRISIHVRNPKITDIQQELKKICGSFTMTDVTRRDILQSIHVGNSNIHHLENLRKIAYDHGKKIETHVTNSDVAWNEFETQMTSTLRYTYPCLVRIFFEMFKCILTQYIPSDKIESTVRYLSTICSQSSNSNERRGQHENQAFKDILQRYTDLTTQCFNPNPFRDLALKEVYNEELSKSQLSVILSNYQRRKQSTATSGVQHNYSVIPMTIANGNDAITFEIKMLNFLIFDCMRIMNDMRQNLCLTKSDAVVSYGTNEATRVHQIIQDSGNSKYDDLKEQIGNVYKHIRKEKLSNYNDMNKSDIIDFLQKKCLWYWDNVINLNLDSEDMKDKFSTWTHYIDTFLTQLLDKNTESLFGTFYLYIDGNTIRNMLQKLRALTWDKLDSLASSNLDPIYRLIMDKKYNAEKHTPVNFLKRNAKDDIVHIQNYKVLMSCSASEIISDDVLHLNDDGHIQSCYCSKLSAEELQIACAHGEVVDRWLDLMFVIMKIQLSFFAENRKRIRIENWNPPTSTQIGLYFEKTQEYFQKKWENKLPKHSLSMSKFSSTKKLKIDKLISDEWNLIKQKWIIDNDVTDVYNSYKKTMEEGGILLECDLKLFLWTVISKQVYPIVVLMGPPEEQESIKGDIVIIFNAAVNNQIALAERKCDSFMKQMNEKYSKDRAASAILATRHMKYVLNVCLELYRLPDFTDMQDLTFMYMSEGLNRIHMGPIH